MHALCDNKQNISQDTQLLCHKCMLKKNLEATYEAQQQICGRIKTWRDFRDDVKYYFFPKSAKMYGIT